MKVSGELHDPAALPKVSPIEYKAASASETLCTLLRRKICLDLPRIEPRIPGRSACTLVRVLSELSRLLFVYSYIGVLAMWRQLLYWPCYDGWCTGHVTTVGVMARLRRLVYWPCYDGRCTGHVTMVNVLAMLQWLVYWPGYNNWCTDQSTMVGVLARLQ